VGPRLTKGFTYGCMMIITTVITGFSQFAISKWPVLRHLKHLPRRRRICFLAEISVTIVQLDDGWFPLQNVHHGPSLVWTLLFSVNKAAVDD
jgi:hypothetical protein